MERLPSEAASGPANAAAPARVGPMERLRHLPPAAQAAFNRFQTSRTAADLDPVIYAILEDFIPSAPERPLAALPGDTRLMDDLGFDSFAFIEIIFFTEELLGITITNEEVVKVRTLDELRHFIHGKATARDPR